MDLNNFMPEEYEYLEGDSGGCKSEGVETPVKDGGCDHSRTKGGYMRHWNQKKGLA